MCIINMYISVLHAAYSPDEGSFVVEEPCFGDLCAALVQPCSCVGRCLWEVSKVDRFGLAVGVTFVCGKCRSKRRWLSSRIRGGKYVINQR